MPRLYVTWNTGQRNQDSDPLDFCRRCWPPSVGPGEDIDTSKYPDLTAKEASDIRREAESNPEGNEHPPYDECEYDCHCCGKRLESKDD